MVEMRRRVCGRFVKKINVTVVGHPKRYLNSSFLVLRLVVLNYIV